MKNVISFIPKDPLSECLELFEKGKNVSFSGAGNSSSRALIISEIARKSAVNNVFYIVSGHQEQKISEKELRIWGELPVYTFSRIKNSDITNFPSRSAMEEAMHHQLFEFISRVLSPEKAVFVLDFESLIGGFPDPKKIERNKIILKKGEEIGSTELIQKLVEIGYEMGIEDDLEKGKYFRKGEMIFLRPINSENEYKITFDFDKIEEICQSKIRSQSHDPLLNFTNTVRDENLPLKSLEIFPLNEARTIAEFTDIISPKDLIIDDEVDVSDEFYDLWNELLENFTNSTQTISFTSFNEDVSKHLHLHYLSVLRYRTAYDFSNDLRDKINADWKTIIFTKHLDEVRGLLVDQHIPHKIVDVQKSDQNTCKTAKICVIPVGKEDTFPLSFQGPVQKLAVLNDTDLAFLREEKKSQQSQTIFNDFLTSLKTGDYVVHADHGIARFLGLEQKTVDKITKEYLKLGYAENDKLFVPIDQADKVNKYIGSEETMPKLTRLGSAEWSTLTNKVRKETQAIAKELLKLYAQRKAAKGHKYHNDTKRQQKFEETFPYQETPGQLKAINDVKKDMEDPQPMDRLVCGDVGFGKTEVAMRAAFKAVENGKQVALVSPITILADQHYKSFHKRMESFGVKIEMLSRFRTASQQKEIIEDLRKGKIDIIVGTHRLLQKDIKFDNLGLVIIDEEQRFGVKQKEKLKEMRKEVDILTLTATPIPRTLNICLNNLRDITTITTPPFGRLPVITEVRKFSPNLMREALMREIERGGQAYVLHNRVQTINSFADQLRELVPEARFCVAHGKLGSGDLEERIMDFTKHKYDVLVSSTIIENGIDLANANTLIVNKAEKFGLAQLYQLRGRVGRGKKQAYAYFLYHGQRLKLDAKKRLRAIVEASDLGSGFQIAMKDLEIRGAGDILGANQHGVINVVGMAHFMRMLNKAVEDIKAGRVMEGEEDPQDVSVELPLPAYIPENYIPSAKDKINSYQRLSAADTQEYLEEICKDLVDDYGKMPREVNNLIKIIELKILAKNAGIINVKSETMPMSKEKEIVLQMSKKVTPANIVNLLEFNNNWKIIGSKLKITLSNLAPRMGDNWLTELQKSLQKLSGKAKHGKKAN